MLAKIEDTPLEGFGDISWAEAVGTRSQELTIELTKSRAEYIFNQYGADFSGETGRSVTLTLGDRKIKNLYVAALLPGTSPRTAKIVLFDQRWIWERVTTKCEFNVTYNTGVTQLIGGPVDINNPNASRVTPVLKYKKYSLNANGLPFTVEEAFYTLMTEVAIAFGKYPNVRRGLFSGVATQIPLQDFIEIGTISQVLESLLQYIPGYDVVIRDNGQIDLIDSHDRSEVNEIKKMGPSVYGSSSHIDMCDRRYMRPAYVDIIFEREHEIRFNFDEARQVSRRSSTTTTDINRDRFLINVVRTVDKALEIPVFQDGQKVGSFSVAPTNSWIPIEQYYTFLQALRTGGLSNQVTINNAYFRKYFLNKKFIRTYAFIDPSSGIPSEVWASRINTILRSFRQDFQLPGVWSQQLKGISASGLETLSYETQTPSNTKVYSQYIAQPAARVAYARNRNQAYYNHGFSADDYSTIGTASPRQTGAEVTVINPEACIFRTFLTTDPYMEALRVYPGLPDEGNKYLPSIVQDSRILHPVIEQFYIPLDPNFKMAVYLMVKPGSTNTKSLYHVRVKYKDAAARARLDPTLPAKGPPIRVFVPSTSLTRAKFAWDENFSQQIEDFIFNTANFVAVSNYMAASGVPGGASATIAGGPLDDLLVNKDFISELAIGYAASTYSKFQDRVEGVGVYPHAPNGAKVTGGIVGRNTTVTKAGTIYDALTIPPIIQGEDPLSYMDQKVRSKLLGIIGSDKL